MAFISKTGISTNNVIEASQITNIIDAFDGTTANQIFMSGPVTASNFHATGSMFGTFTGNLAGNASTATTATTATTAVTASYAIKAQNAFTSSLAISSSYAVTSSLSTSASFAAFSATSTSASLAATASYVSNAVSASYAATSSYSDYSAFAQINSFPLIYSGYGLGAAIPVGAPLNIASTILPVASLGFVGSSYVGSDFKNARATAIGTEPVYIKFAIAGSGSFGLLGGTGGTPYIVGPSEVITINCYINNQSTAGGSPGAVNPTWNTNVLVGSNSAYAYLWNTGVGPTYYVETAWQLIDMSTFGGDSLIGLNLIMNNGTTRNMTVDKATMYISLEKP